MTKKEFRIILTEKCNANCPNCFNKDYRLAKDMTYENAKFIAKFLSNGGVEKLKIMGGEPTTHEEFPELFEMLQYYFKTLILFTNAKNDLIYKINPRDEDSIIYNFNFINKDFNDKKLLLSKKGIRNFEVQVTNDMDLNIYKEKLRLIKQGLSNSKKLNLYLTLDCTSNIFLNRNKIIENWNDLTQFIENELKSNFYIDHIIPLCFYKNSNMNIKQIPYICNYMCAGLIDTNLDLRYCNQYPKILTHIDENISFKEVIELLKNGYEDKMKFQRESKCSVCKNFEISCNGGCFTNSKILQKKR